MSPRSKKRRKEPGSVPLSTDSGSSAQDRYWKTTSISLVSAAGLVGVKSWAIAAASPNVHGGPKLLKTGTTSFDWPSQGPFAKPFPNVVPSPACGWVNGTCTPKNPVVQWTDSPRFI